MGVNAGGLGAAAFAAVPDVSAACGGYEVEGTAREEVDMLEMKEGIRPGEMRCRDDGDWLYIGLCP